MLDTHTYHSTISHQGDQYYINGKYCTQNPCGMSHGPVYEGPVIWYVIRNVLAVIYDDCTSVLGTGCTDCTHNRKKRNHCICMHQPYIVFFYGVRLVWSCQILDHLSLYFKEVPSWHIRKSLFHIKSIVHIHLNWSVNLFLAFISTLREADLKTCFWQISMCHICWAFLHPIKVR